MSSPARIKLGTSSHGIAVAPNLVAPNVSLQKAQSIDRDGRFWIGRGQASVRSPHHWDVRGVLAELLLPRIIFHDRGLRETASMLADFVCVLLSFIVMRYGNAPMAFRLTPSFAELAIVLLYGTLLTLLGYSEHLYRADTIRETRAQTITLMKVVGWPALLVGVVMESAGTHAISMKTLAIAASLNFLTMLGWRTCWQLRSGRNNHRRNVLIVGAGVLGRKVAARLNPDRAVVGFLDNNGPVLDDVLGRIEELASVARAKFVDEIIVALPHRQDLARVAIEEAHRNGLDIKMVPDLHGFEMKSARLENCGGIPLLTLNEELIPEFYRLLKRVLDIAVSLFALILLMPLLAAIALTIRLDSEGPVFYRAPRVGKKGNRFLCQKFRTMVTNADKLKELLRARNERHGACFKITDDPRITRVGGFLRRYSLDELPQLWNVLCGDMSLVGPRPHPPDDVERYELEDLRRLDVTPGITGLWQVKARRDPSFRRNVELDVEYIEHWNFWTDLSILYQTVSVVLQGSGV
ncbi:MAG TPA: sugar transferase [Terriglobales bacterium]|nr:sugar transferase [Terriglobales bacterium]